MPCELKQREKNREKITDENNSESKEYLVKQISFHKKGETNQSNFFISMHINSSDFIEA